MEIFMSDAVIGTLIGSLITILGIIVNNYFQSTARHKEHIRDIKAKIFMDALRVLVKSRTVLVKMPILPMKELLEEQKRAVFPSELYLWATNQTIRAVIDLHAAITHAVMLYLPLNAPIVDLEHQAAIVESQEWSNDKDVKLLRIHKHINKLKKDLLDKCTSAYYGMENLQSKVILCMREELGAKFDVHQYLNVMESGHAQMEKARKEFDEMMLFVEGLRVQTAEKNEKMHGRKAG